MQFGHVPGGVGNVEIHAVQSGDEGQRHQDGGDDGQYPNDVVHFVRHDVLVDVGEGIGDFVAGIDEFFGLDDVFDKVFQIGFQFNGFFDLASLSQSGAQFLVGE